MEMVLLSERELSLQKTFLHIQSLAVFRQKPIRKRFSQETIDFLLKIKWWNWSEEHIRQHITEIQLGNIEYLR